MFSRALPATARRNRPWRYLLVAAILAGTTAAASWSVAGPWRTAAADVTPISQGKPATASSTEGRHWSPSAAVDGDLDTRWSSAFSDPQWLAVDLGGLVNVDQAVLHWQSAHATAYEIQVSVDGSAWAPIYRTTDGAGGVQRLDITGQGRYVRMHGITRATRYGYSLWEFQVFGQLASDATPGASASPTHDHSPSAAPGTPDPDTSHPGTPAPGSSPGDHGPGPGDYVLADPPVTGVVPSRANPPRKAHREFQANCAVSHLKSDDPIVFPNRPGDSHNHTFMGNTTTDAASTTQSLLAGGTLCRVPGDRSGYWMPTLFNGDTPVPPVGHQVIYYKSGVRDYTSVRPFPAGLRFLVGSPTTTAAQFVASPAYQKGWECGDSYDNVDFPATCPAGTQLNIRMQAPSCWDGRHLDTPDHVSHIVYPVDGVCPDDHPVAVPMIEFKMAFPVSGDMSQVELASGRGFSFHYDFYNAWEMPVLEALVSHCINAGRQCDARGYSQFDPDAGAALDEMYQLPGSRTALSRAGWTASSSRSGDSDGPQKMLDGDARTRWTSGTAMTPGMAVTVDMSAVRSVSQIALRSGGADHPRAYEVYLSTDGVSWGGPVASGKGTSELTVASFDRRAARYIKVVQTGSGSNWWSIAEIVAYD
ncbi:F5/8 type C domain-containing protein [Micromonospora sp. Llam0]|uniref:DUF1996 domain-containing protein n=1 Tax=Micromonospora sp. Llam0 TaxID=2485143 RepID=UPI000F47EBE2|nr:DUF1996 domain-containing protein [Micromonospora sp. Llam0]ROO63196.1 F5/8 type C domain-containing protein [Micromonospora sp. Llam0]